MDLINKVRQLYHSLPQVDCRGCGQCCVSPTCTLTEFIYTFNSLQKQLTSEKLKEYILAPAIIHKEYEGNIQCVFLKENRCSIYSRRVSACRLFGIPSLDQLEILNMEKCKKNITTIKGNSDISFLKSWLEQLFNLDKTLYNFCSDPYFIKGFNIQCWLDIYFNEFLNFDVFIDIKKVMKQYLDLSQFESIYTQKTKIKEKFDKITILSSLIGTNNGKTIIKVLESLKKDYPKTGTYFYDESVEFTKIIKREQRKSQKS